jgi:AraC-like DNA-binding protein
VEKLTTDIPTFRFSSDDLPGRDRLPMMREVFGRLIARVDLEPTPDEPLHFRVVAKAFPGLTISSYSATPMISRRTRALLADGNDDVVLAGPATAGNMASHVGREWVAGAGQMVLFSAADLNMIKTVSTPHCHVISLQRRLLAAIVPDLEDRFLRPIPSENEALRLLTSYIRLFEDQQSLATPELRHLVVNHVYDLLALALGGTRDAVAIANGRGLRAARLHAIKTEIVSSLRRHDLSLAGLAARHGVSPRYVQMLFESDGTTFSRFLLEQRLERAHRMLSDPRIAERTISAIAYAAGFGDLSHFNRAFRRRYGETPSDVRAGSRHPDWPIGGNTA